MVVKLGGDGALVARPGSPAAWVPAAPAEVVDPTGAGDSFCGGFAAGLALGEDPAEAAWRGCVTAAAAIGAVGSLRLLDRGWLARDLLAGRASAGGPAAGAEAASGPATGGSVAARQAPGGQAESGQAESGQAESGQAGARQAEGGQDDYGIETMDREIATIPDVIAGQFADPGGHVRELGGWLAARRIEHLYLTGCGDSAFAGLAAALAFRRHSRLQVHSVHALDFARYDVRYLPSASAVLAISYSGKVGRTIEAARQAAAFGVPVIALTGRADGELAAAADRILPIDVPTLGFSPAPAPTSGCCARSSSWPGGRRGPEATACCGTRASSCRARRPRRSTGTTTPRPSSRPG